MRVGTIPACTIIFLLPKTFQPGFGYGIAFLSILSVQARCMALLALQDLPMAVNRYIVL